MTAPAILLPGTNAPLDCLSDQFVAPVDPRDLRENCRLLGIVSKLPPNQSSIFEILQTFGLPSYPQNNGWSLACYSDISKGGLLAVPGEPMIIRSQIPAAQDVDLFQAASTLMLRLKPSLLLGHLRNASSGCQHIADPHPFSMEFDNKQFLMIHNGGIWGKDLDYLIDYLISGQTLPKSCPGSPIDSEYLFIYLMELIEKNNGEVWISLRQWAETLIEVLGDEWNALNILVTDGEILWGVRMSYRQDRFTLHYSTSPDYELSSVSTQALDSNWLHLPNFSLFEMRAGHPVYIEMLPHPILNDYSIHHKVKPPNRLTHVKTE